MYVYCAVHNIEFYIKQFGFLGGGGYWWEHSTYAWASLHKDVGKFRCCAWHVHMYIPRYVTWWEAAGARAIFSTIVCTNFLKSVPVARCYKIIGPVLYCKNVKKNVGNVILVHSKLYCFCLFFMYLELRNLVLLKRKLSVYEQADLIHKLRRYLLGVKNT
jgi:hypothetical protein